MSQALPIKPQGDLTADKAWLLGLIAGDGHVRIRADGSSSVDIACGPDEQLARCAAEVIERVYAVPSNVSWDDQAKYDKVGCWHLLCTRKAVCMDLLSLASFGLYSWTVPRDVKRGTRAIRCAWVSGYFDAEGSAILEPERAGGGRSRRISAASVNKTAMDDVRDLLVGLGYDVSYSPFKASGPDGVPTDYWKVYFDRRSLHERWQKEVGFRCARKHAIMVELLATYKRGHYQSSEKVDEIAPLVGRLVKAGFFHKEIAAHLGLRVEQVKGICKTRGFVGERRGRASTRNRPSITEFLAKEAS